MKVIALIALTAFCSFSGLAADAPKPNPYQEPLKKVTAAELPAKVAQYVKEARASERETTTVSVVRAAVQMNPAAAPAIVGAIARAVPAMASVAAATAAAEQPKQASAIAKAAAAAAPSMAEQIVAAVCRTVPSGYQGITIAASQAAPNAGKEILNGLATGIPELRPYLATTLAGYNGNSSVPNTVVQLPKVPSPVASGGPLPGTGPGSGNTTTPPPEAPHDLGGNGAPFIPVSNTPTNTPPSGGGSGPPSGGGRDYAAP